MYKKPLDCYPFRYRLVARPCRSENRMYFWRVIPRLLQHDKSDLEAQTCYNIKKYKIVYKILPVSNNLVVLYKLLTT